MNLPKMIEQAKRRFKVSDEGLAPLLREVEIECTGRTVFAWRTGRREPDANARRWIEQQIPKLMRRATARA